jgi:hypothetical protein|tara:strand:+ start:1638 stop:1787 length:150 start_codon:yes stop_codon:yes gene_type:complete
MSETRTKTVADLKIINDKLKQMKPKEREAYLKELELNRLEEVYRDLIRK